MTLRIAADRRPSEVVRAYLESEFSRPEILSGTRLPSIKALSRHLKVSSSTVQAVLEEWTKRGKVRAIQGSGVYFVKPEATTEKERVVAINIDPGQIVPTNVWGGLIAMGVLNALTQGKKKVLLRPAGAGADSAEKESRESDGAILFANYRSGLEFEAAFSRVGKPVVFINPPAANATSNFVSTDYFGNARRLAEAWIATGRTHICLVLHSSPGKSMGALLTLAGFTTAIEAASSRQKIHFTYHLQSQLSQKEAKKFIDAKQQGKNGLPDAFYFFLPASAEIALEELLSRGITVPEEVSIASGTSEECLPPSGNRLTVFAQSLDRLGTEAVRMLFWRWEHNAQSAPGLYMPCRYVAGSTTREVENLYMQKEGARL